MLISVVLLVATELDMMEWILWFCIIRLLVSSNINAFVYSMTPILLNRKLYMSGQFQIVNCYCIACRQYTGYFCWFTGNCRYQGSKWSPWPDQLYNQTQQVSRAQSTSVDYFNRIFDCWTRVYQFLSRLRKFGKDTYEQ